MGAFDSFPQERSFVNLDANNNVCLNNKVVKQRSQTINQSIKYSVQK